MPIAAIGSIHAEAKPVHVAILQTNQSVEHDV